jgi:ABC-type enterochelin transport system permease subunit
MIRWYDWVAALIAADAILTAVGLALGGPTFWAQFLGALLVSLCYDLWANIYCTFRKNMEQKG